MRRKRFLGHPQGFLISLTPGMACNHTLLAEIPALCGGGGGKRNAETSSVGFVRMYVGRVYNSARVCENSLQMLALSAL